MPLTVTFDTNALASVVAPETAQRGEGPSGAAVRAAIQDARIRGFFSETLLTLEGIENKDRPKILGKTGVVTQTSSPRKNTINIAVGVQHFRDALNPQFSARVQAALTLGMCALWAPDPWGGLHLTTDDCPLFEPPGGIFELAHCRDNAAKIATEITKRGVGRAVAIDLGLGFSKRDNVSTPELFSQALGRAQSNTERRQVAWVVREWADGNSVAAHYGFGIDLFCSADRGKTASAPSVLDDNNRKWLREEFGLQFVTLAELPARAVE